MGVSFAEDTSPRRSHHASRDINHYHRPTYYILEPLIGSLEPRECPTSAGQGTERLRTRFHLQMSRFENYARGAARLNKPNLMHQTHRTRVAGGQER